MHWELVEGEEMTIEPASPFGDTQTKYFYELTPERILAAVEALGFRCTGRCFALNSFENRVYQVEIEVEGATRRTPQADRFRIFKFYRPGRWSKEQILDEHQFLQDLAEYEIPVVPPVALEGRTLFEIPDAGIYYAGFPQIGGRAPDELSAEEFERVGRLLARMHGVGATRSAAHRLVLNEETYGRRNLAQLVEANVLPPEHEAHYRELVDAVCLLAAPLFRAAKNQRIHGDCHLGNLLFGDRGFFWVDFDDMLQGPCVQDLWLLLPGRDEYAKKQLDLLLGGYEQMRDFDRASLALIEPLRALRIIHFNAWIAKRWSDPIFPRTFVEFGTNRYWSEQIRVLEEQVALIRGVA